MVDVRRRRSGARVARRHAGAAGGGAANRRGAGWGRGGGAVGRGRGRTSVGGVAACGVRGGRSVPSSRRRRRHAGVGRRRSAGVGHWRGAVRHGRGRAVGRAIRVRVRCERRSADRGAVRRVTVWRRRRHCGRGRTKLRRGGAEFGRRRNWTRAFYTVGACRGARASPRRLSQEMLRQWSVLTSR